MTQPVPVNHAEALFIKMDDDSFQRLSTYVTREYGIKLPPSKRSMLESRLNKKVKSLGLRNYTEFVNHILGDEGKRSDLMDVIDLITTNKTDFFREPEHFRFLSDTFLPQWIEKAKGKCLNIWSAGCSTGEEPYTLLMVLEEFKRKYPMFNYSILATDVSFRVLQAAYQGIYSGDKVRVLPLETQRKYLLRSKAQPDLYRIKPEYRKKIAYKRINLMDDVYPVTPNEFHIIFCRNVLIYFSKQVQEKLIRNFSSHLHGQGILFLGHSESMMGMEVPFKQLRPTIYQVV